MLQPDSSFNVHLDSSQSLNLQPLLRIDTLGSYLLWFSIIHPSKDADYWNEKYIPLYVLSTDSGIFVFPHEPENFYPPLPIEIPDTTGLPNLEGKGGITIAGRIYYKVPKDIEEEDTQPVPNVLVQGNAYYLNGTSAGFFWIFTDEDGYYRVDGLPSGLNWLIIAYAENDAAWIAQANHGPFPQYWYKENVTQSIYDANISVTPSWGRILYILHNTREFCKEKFRWVRQSIKTFYHEE